MSIDDQLIIKVLLVLVTGLVSLGLFFMKKWFEKSEEDRRELAKKLLRVSEALVDVEKRTAAQLAKFDKNSAENKLELGYKMDLILKDQGKIEGRLTDHMSMISSYISTMRNMSDKIEAVFRFIDAQPRGTDLKRDAR